MTVYLIECGHILILYVKEQQQYFIANEHPDYFQQFISGKLQCEQWRGGKKFQFDQNLFTDNTEDLPKEKTLGKNSSEEELLILFYLPENNPGAVIASRSDAQEAPMIYNKYRFKSIF